jgi:hypothetical protein
MKEYRVNVYVPWIISGCYIVDVDIEADNESEAIGKAKEAVRDMEQDEILEDFDSCGGNNDMDDPEFLNTGPEFSPECNIEWEKELSEDDDDGDDDAE